MTKAEAQTLEAGDRVLFMDDEDDAGTVTEVHRWGIERKPPIKAVTIEWDNGETGTLDADHLEAVSIDVRMADHR